MYDNGDGKHHDGVKVRQDTKATLYADYIRHVKVAVILAVDPNTVPLAPWISQPDIEDEKHVPPSLERRY